MKKAILFIAMLSAIPAMAMSATLTKTGPIAYGGYLVNESGLAYSTSATLDVDSYGARKVSAVVSLTSTTFTSGTFTDGTQSTGSVTVASTTSLSGVTLKINRITLTAGTDYVVDVPTKTATNIAAAINANSFLAPIILAEASGSVVTSTSVAVGGNYTMAVSNAAKLTLSGANMTGGTGAYYSAASDTIRIASHGYTLGLPVLYTQGAAIGGLTDQTTYYVIPVDTNSIKLSATSTGAIAGLPVNITTQRAQLTANTYTLAPLEIDGNASYKWQESNDGTTYFDMGVSSVTVVSPYTLDVSTQDFSDVNFRYLRLNITAPTYGGIQIKAATHVKE